MSNRPAFDIQEIPRELIEQLIAKGALPPGAGRARRQRSMSKDDVRAAAIRVLAVVAHLTPAERRRVFAHAGRMNDV